MRATGKPLFFREDANLVGTVGVLTPGARPCALPRPTFLCQKGLLRWLKREDDGREGAISGRLARKATGVSPSGFAHTGVFAEKEACRFPRTLLGRCAPLHSAWDYGTLYAFID